MKRVIVALLVLTAFAGSAFATKRVALVIGNSNYRHTPVLANPTNDADDIARVFETLNFEVMRGLDLSKAAMDQKLRDFANLLPGADLAVFFYAGHGLQVSGDNYLVPIDAKAESRSALDFEMMRLSLVQRTMESEAKASIIFLDACRNNPLTRNLARALGHRSTSLGRGLAETNAGFGTLISFATQPGNVALDGRGRNSPYTAALKRHLKTANLDISNTLIRVRVDVAKRTNNQQIPWEQSALMGQLYLEERNSITSEKKGKSIHEALSQDTALSRLSEA
ncbi:MAG: caspase family protein, partial [Hyphomicrobiaceae bacterium]